MGRVFQVKEEFIEENSLKDEVNEILKVLKEKKRTYSMNIFILKETVEALENEVKELANSKIYQ